MKLEINGRLVLASPGDTIYGAAEIFAKAVADGQLQQRLDDPPILSQRLGIDAGRFTALRHPNLVSGLDVASLSEYGYLC